MSNRKRVWAAVGMLVLTGCGEAEPLRQLSSAEVDALLKGNTVEGTLVMQSRQFRQYFGADGVTVQVSDNQRRGAWRLEGDDQFCIRWERGDKRGENGEGPAAGKAGAGSDATRKGNCFRVKQDSKGNYRIFGTTLGYTALVTKVVPGNAVKP